MVSKSSSPLLGFNNNVRHRGKIFHIQTEDSGVKHPHVITHLFMDGGRILKTSKTPYIEHLGKKNLSELVRQMMKDQHKAMFLALRDGQLDALIERSSSGSSLPAPPRGASLAPQASVQPTAAMVTKTSGAPSIPPAAAAAPKPPVVPKNPSPGALGSPPREALPAGALGSPPREAPSAAASPVTRHLPTAPPPPRPMDVRARPDSPQSDESQQHTQHPPLSVVTPASSQPETSPVGGRLTAPRPAPAAFSASRPTAEGRSIFGEDLISEKSLDEVILSYLAEDLDTPPANKK